MPSNLNDITQDPTIQDLIVRCENDTGLFGMSFMAGAFDRPNTHLHRQFLELMDDDTKRRKIVMAPRGIGKTTWCVAHCVKCICLRQARFILYVSKSESHAMKQTENIKSEILQNQELRGVFGNLKARKLQDQELEFAKTAWTACDPTTGEPITYVVPRGVGQQVRGLLVRLSDGQYMRPDLIIVDDSVDDKRVMNEDLRREDHDWVMNALLRVVDNYDTDRWRIFWIDTFRHEDSPAEKLMTSPQWHALRLSACDRNFKTTIPEILPQDKLDEIIQEYRDQGKLDGFAREFMNLAIPVEDQAFTSNMFIEYDEPKLKHDNPRGIDGFIIVDPARSAMPKSDFSAAVALGVDFKEEVYYVRDLMQERLMPDVFIERVLDMAQALKINVIGVEVSGGDELIKHPYKQAAVARAMRIEWIWLKSKRPANADYGTGREAAKRARVGKLISYYRRGQMRHNRRVTGPLEIILLRYPRPTHWDSADALGYMPEMLEFGKRYFRPPDDVLAEQDAEYAHQFSSGGPCETGDLIEAGGLYGEA